MADKPDSSNIKITPEFLRKFQDEALKPLVDELTNNKNQHVLELAQTVGSSQGKRRLLAGSEAWDPARILIERYEGPQGTAPTLYAQITSIHKYLTDLNDRITALIVKANRVENDNLDLTSELTTYEMSVVLNGNKQQAPGSTPPPGPGTGS